MSIFAKTMTKAIRDYRSLLRRYLTQSDRMAKLKELNLRNTHLYKSDIALYEVAHRIVEDIETNLSPQKNGYYSYSGVAQFANNLRKYLSDYYTDNGKVVHRAQKASRALLTVIQMTSLPNERLTDEIAKTLLECNLTIVNHGSDEQCELHMQTLEKQQALNPAFYTRIIAHLKSLMLSENNDSAAAA